MNIYVWKRIEKATSSYHTEGGLLVVAENEERAREIANMYEDVEVLQTEIVSAVFPTTHKVLEQVIVFPDAGCC